MIKYLLLALVLIGCGSDKVPYELRSFYCTSKAQEGGVAATYCENSRSGCNEVRLTHDPIEGKSATTPCSYESGMWYFYPGQNTSVHELFDSNYKCLKRQRYLKSKEPGLPMSECKYERSHYRLMRADKAMATSVDIPSSSESLGKYKKHP